MSWARSLRRVAATLAGAAACQDPPSPPPPPADPPPVKVAPPVAIAPPALAMATAAPRTGVFTLEQPRLDLPHLETFALIDAGNGPRAPLRYALAAGAVAFHTETTLSSRHVGSGTFTEPVAMPALRDAIVITVAADQPGKLALRALAAEAAVANKQADEYLSRWRNLLQNRRATIAFDPRGQFSAIQFGDDPTGARSSQARDALAERLLTVTVPLPAEPVGVGASWRVITIMRQGFAHAKQTATYTLTAREPSRWKLHVKLQRIAKEQRISDPSLPSGTTADLLAMFRLTEGDVEIDPRYPVIATGSLGVESRLHARFQPPGAGAVAMEQVVEDTGTITLSHEP